MTEQEERLDALATEMLGALPPSLAKEYAGRLNAAIATAESRVQELEGERDEAEVRGFREGFNGAEDQLAHLARLEEALRPLAEQPCREFPKERPGTALGPPKFSCWTVQTDARAGADDYRDDYVAEVLADDWPCDSCRARAALTHSTPPSDDA